MNTNCTKCGNPLQPGTTICPVCGTNNINVAAQPVQPAAPAQPVAPAAPAQPAVADVAQQPAAPVAPAPAAPAAPATPEVAPQVAAPVTPAAPAAPAVSDVTVTGVQPVVPAATGTIPTASAVVPPAPTGKKTGSKKTLIIIIAVAVALLAVGAVVFFILNNNGDSGSNTNNSGTNNSPAPTPTPTVNPNSNSKNNYMDFSYNLPTGWTATDESGILNIYNEDETVNIMLQGVLFGSYSEDITKDGLVKGFEETDYTNVEVEQTSVNNQNAYLVKATIDDLSYVFNFYYIYNANKDIISATVIYTDTAAQNKNSARVTKFLESVKYNEDSERALDNSDLYNTHSNNAIDIITGNGGSGEEVDPFGEGSFSGF